MEPLHPRDLRISDLDRHRVAEVLRQAAGDGRLDAEELDERLEATYAARTFADLVPLTEDLPDHVDLTPPAPLRPPPPLPRGPVPGAPAGPVGPLATPGSTAPPPMPPSRTLEEALGSLWPGASAPPPAPWPTDWTWRTGPPPPVGPPPGPATTWSVASDTHRGTGRWSPGPRHTVSTVAGNVTLDLRRADLPPVLDLRVRAVMGSVVVLVPAGVRLDVAGLPVLGSFAAQGAEGGEDLGIELPDGAATLDPVGEAAVPPGFGPPLVRVRGVAVMGSVVVRRSDPDDVDEPDDPDEPVD